VKPTKWKEYIFAVLSKGAISSPLQNSEDAELVLDLPRRQVRIQVAHIDASHERNPERGELFNETQANPIQGAAAYTKLHRKNTPIKRRKSRVA
jgi:hypothetical protein